MYVCICHALKEKDVRRVVCEGDISIACVYKKLGCKPRCGKCLGTMAEIIAAEGQQDAERP